MLAVQILIQRKTEPYAHTAARLCPTSQCIGAAQPCPEPTAAPLLRGRASLRDTAVLTGTAPGTSGTSQTTRTQSQAPRLKSPKAGESDARRCKKLQELGTQRPIPSALGTQPPLAARQWLCSPAAPIRFPGPVRRGLRGTEVLPRHHDAAARCAIPGEAIC